MTPEQYKKYLHFKETFLDRAPTKDMVRKNYKGKKYIPVSISRPAFAKLFPMHKTETTYTEVYNSTKSGKMFIFAKVRITAHLYIDDEFICEIIHEAFGSAEEGNKDETHIASVAEGYATRKAIAKFGKFFGMYFEADDAISTNVTEVQSTISEGVNKKIAGLPRDI